MVSTKTNRRPPMPNLDPAVVEARRIVENLEREIVHGAVRSYKFYQSIKDTVCPWNAEKLTHRLDFSVHRYNFLWRFISSFYQRFEGKVIEKDFAIPNMVLGAYVIDSSNANNTPYDMAAELVAELRAEKDLTESLTYDSLIALSQSAAFSDWLSSRILEQTVGHIASGKSLGMLTLANLETMVAEAKSAAGQIGLAKKINARLHNPLVEIPQPTARYSVGEIPVCTPGNLTTLSGHSKTGKSSVVGALIASTYAGEHADCLTFKSANIHGHGVVHIDTEQSLYDHQKLIKTTARRAGQPFPNWIRSYCLTGFSFSEISRAIPLLLEQCRVGFGGVHSMILDGVADAVLDVNDPSESNAIVAELHTLAIRYDCSIIVCIHVNPGSNPKMRGHLGSQCERKAETNLMIEKDKNEVSVLWADKNRRSPIFKKNGPQFIFDHDLDMHVGTESMEQIKRESTTKLLRGTFQAVFAGHQSMTHTDLKTALVASLKASVSTAERKIQSAFTAGIIDKNNLHQYALMT